LHLSKELDGLSWPYRVKGAICGLLGDNVVCGKFYLDCIKMSVAGSKGGIYRNSSPLRGSEIPIVKNWQDVGQKRLKGIDLYRELLYSAQPTQLEIGIGNTCGLQCQHCFLGYESGEMSGSLIPIPRLLSATTEFVQDLGSRIVCVTDRDALTPNRSIPFFEHLAGLRETYTDLKFGGVTNGISIHKFADDLEKIRLDYLDVSLDGLKKEHDTMRGDGAFDKTLANIRLALERKLADRLIIATTLTKFNDESIIDLIRYLIVEEGVQWIDVSPLMAVKMQDYQLSESDTVKFLNNLFKMLSSIQASSSTTVIFEICAYCAAFIPALVESGWLTPEQISKDQYGHLYQDIQVNDSIKITLKPELIPEYWRHTVRITADGYVVGGCEPLTQPNYKDFSVGNIIDNSVKDLYKKALEIGSPFYNMMLAYDYSECRDKACFLHCLGGDSLLAKAVYDTYNRKDPNCTWNEYSYRDRSKELVNAV
jgi:MoaA/NifB/PqqE/SkfB family radical SAM enzyme